ncbi:hypothetical protein T09_7035 [Trichinella sp. T9]|nr:hypothetical protein T09_7035 [Trichinella sp. T9]
MEITGIQEVSTQMPHIPRFLLTKNEDCYSYLGCSRVIPSVCAPLRTLHGRSVLILILCWICGRTNADANCCRNIRLCCSVQDHHEQQDISELSCCILSGVLQNHLVDNVFSVFGFIAMINDFRYFFGGCDLISSVP